MESADGPDLTPRTLGDFLARAAAQSPPETVILERTSARAAATSTAETYRNFERDVRALALGLLTHDWSFGRLQRGDRVALFLDNCRLWLLADQALAYAGLVSVPRGSDTTGTELRRILEHSEAKLALLAAQLELEVPDACDRRTLDDEGIADLLERGLSLLDSEAGDALLREARPAPDDLFTIVYTSGTTGEPKGVMLTHANLVSNVRGTVETLDYPKQGTMISILPSWHMFERVFEYVSIACACKIVYTDTRRVAEDIRSYRPHVVAFVPRIWERFAIAIEKRLSALRGFRAFVVRRVRSLGRRALRAGSPRWLRRAHLALAKRLLSAVHDSLGGRLVLAASGGGALPPEVDRLMLELGVPLLNGYGLTETSPVLACRRPNANRITSIGPPLPGTEIKVVKDGEAVGVGEVGELIARGPQVMRGYYKNEAATRAVLSEDGWFRTGDLGSCDASGWLSITGRIKDTIVLKGGENIEPEPIEGRVKTSPWIDQVMLVGQDQKIVGALVVVDAEHCAAQLAGFDADRIAVDEALRNELRKALRTEFDRLLTEDAGFRRIDRVGPFSIITEPFTQENGMMTATLKLRRHVIAERYADTISALFA